MTKNLRQKKRKEDSAETQNRFFSRKNIKRASNISKLQTALFFKDLNKPGSPDIGNRM